MGLRPTQGDEKRLLSSNRSLWKRRSPLCHPERTRISYYAAPEMATCAAFYKESRMRFADPTKLDRKSGAAEGSAVPRTSLGNVFRRSVAQRRDMQFPPPYPNVDQASTVRPATSKTNRFFSGSASTRM
jgi:hypothetical protein